MLPPFIGFMSRFSNEELETVWKWGGLGDLMGDPDAPYPGRRVMAKFLQPIPGSWRDILRRAVRTKRNRPEAVALLTLLARLRSAQARLQAARTHLRMLDAARRSEAQRRRADADRAALRRRIRLATQPTNAP